MKPPKASIYIFSSCELVVNSSSFDEVRKMTESNTIQLSNGVQKTKIYFRGDDEEIINLKSLPAKIHSGFLKKVDLIGCSKLEKLPQILEILSSAGIEYGTPPLQNQDSVTLSSSPPNSQLRDRSHRTHLLTTEAELGSTSPPLSPSHSSLLLRSPSYSSSPPRSPSWAQPRPLHSPWPPPSWAQPHPPHQLQDVDLEWIFVITNFVLEIPSAVFDQLSSARKPQYVLLGMLLSFAALVVCLVELIYTCQKQKVVWRWKGTLPWPWFYSRSRNRPFGNFKDIIGLVCALCQCIFAAIHYSFARRHADSPIKICFWPLVFAFGLLCSKVLAK